MGQTANKEGYYFKDRLETERMGKNTEKNWGRNPWDKFKLMSRMSE